MNVIVLGITLPVFVAMLIMPTLEMYFKPRATAELIGSVELVRQGITLLVGFAGCWKGGLGIFLKMYYPAWIMAMIINIIIAVLGAEHIEIRFFLEVVESAMCIAIAGQSISYYALKVFKDDTTKIILGNRQRVAMAIGGMLGSFIATIIGQVEINVALWGNVLLSLICFALNTGILVLLKKVIKEQEEEK
jgi:hypothetical protein